jgi:putative ABC transport system substrate-binding protein
MAGKIFINYRRDDSIATAVVTKVEMIINMKTAKALGITVSLPLSGRADEVIE